MFFFLLLPMRFRWPVLTLPRFILLYYSLSLFELSFIHLLFLRCQHHWLRPPSPSPPPSSLRFFPFSLIVARDGVVKDVSALALHNEGVNVTHTHSTIPCHGTATTVVVTRNRTQNVTHCLHRLSAPRNEWCSCICRKGKITFVDIVNGGWECVCDVDVYVLCAVNSLYRLCVHR